MSNKHLPLWLQHANGDIPTPTTAEVEKDFQREAKAAQDAINGKPDSKETRDMHAALMADYGSMTLDGKPTGGRMATLGNALSRIDWHKVFVRAVQALVLVAFLFAGFKLYAIWQQYPGMAFLPFLDMHPLMMIFSGLFSANYIQHRDTEGMGIVALLSTGLNSLLV
jgi:hypothetical protein